MKILIWDHNKELVYERAKEVLADPKTREYVSGVAFHWYTGDHFEGLSLVQESFPEKELIFTEGCVEYSRFADTNEVRKAQMYAHDIIGNMNHGANGFIDWNLLLDEKGDPIMWATSVQLPSWLTHSMEPLRKDFPTIILVIFPDLYVREQSELPIRNTPLSWK